MVVKYSYNQLFQFVYNIFIKTGCSVEHADMASKVLLSADMRGIDSHGVAR